MNPPTDQDLLAGRRLAAPLQDAGLGGRSASNAAVTSANALRFAAQHPNVLGQMAPPPRPSSAPLPPSMAGLRPIDALAGSQRGRTHLNRGAVDAQQLLVAQASTQLGAGPSTPFQARSELTHACACSFC